MSTLISHAGFESSNTNLSHSCAIGSFPQLSYTAGNWKVTKQLEFLGGEPTLRKKFQPYHLLIFKVIYFSELFIVIKLFLIKSNYNLQIINYNRSITNKISQEESNQPRKKQQQKEAVIYISIVTKIICLETENVFSNSKNRQCSAKHVVKNVLSNEL